METQTHSVPVESSGGFQQSAFKVELSQHTFNVLSSGLYSNKHLAIVRELACNAWDAHVAAGNTNKPFDVFLPNSIEPTFRIRDYGIGLADDDVMSLYTTYFASTKQRSNAMTGCFGLGSKSPFAYTKSFTVVSYFNGTKTTFNCFIGKEGFPQCVRLGSETTTEHNGLDVSFVVAQHDHYLFVNAANESLRWFSVEPRVRGSSQYSRNAVETITLQGNGWRILPGSGNNLAIMGNVAYPLTKQHGFSEIAKRLMSLHIHVDFPIGSFEVTPSREGISYTEYSIANISNRLEQIYSDVTNSVTDMLSSAKTLYEARQVVQDYLDNSAFRFLGIVPEWKGIRVRANYNVDDLGVSALRVRKFKATARKRNAQTKNSADIDFCTYVNPSPNVKFYWADFPSAEKRLGNHVRDNFDRDQIAYLLTWSPKPKPILPTKVVDLAADDDIDGNDVDGSDDADLKEDDDLKDAEDAEELTADEELNFEDVIRRFADGLGIDVSQIERASTIPKRIRTYKANPNPNVRRSRLAGSKARAYTLKDGYSTYSDECWDEAEIDMNEGGVYVELNRFNPVDPNVKTYDFKNILKTYATIFEKDFGRVVGVRTANLKKFKNSDDWLTVREVIHHDILELWENNPDFRYCHWLCEKASPYRSDVEYDDSFFALVETIKALLPNADVAPWMWKLAVAVERFHKWKPTVDRLKGLGYFFTSDELKHRVEPRYVDLKAKMRERYPMLMMVYDRRSYIDADEMPLLVDYITLVEKAKTDSKEK